MRETLTCYYETNVQDLQGVWYWSGSHAL